MKILPSTTEKLHIVDNNPPQKLNSRKEIGQKKMSKCLNEIQK